MFLTDLLNSLSEPGTVLYKRDKVINFRLTWSSRGSQVGEDVDT